MAVQISLDKDTLEKLAKITGKVRPRVISDGVEYGVFVEYGTSRMSARPVLRPAFEKVTKSIPRAIGQAVERGVNVDDVLSKAARDIQALWASGVPVDTGALRNSIHVEDK